MSKRLKTRKLGCERLDARMLMASDVMEVEPNDVARNATPFQLAVADEVRLIGSSTSKNDKDYFSFKAAANSTINVAHSFTGATSSIEVENRQGVKLLSVEPKNGKTSGSFSAHQGDVYFVRVRSDANSASNYKVSLSNASAALTSPTADDSSSTSPGADDSGHHETEHQAEDKGGRSKLEATAASLTTLAPTVLTGTIDKNTKSFFVVTPDQSGIVTLQGSASVKISVESKSGVKLLETEPKDNLVSGSFAVEQGEAFFVRVRGISTSKVDYSVPLTLAADPLAPISPTPGSSIDSLERRLDLDGDDSVSPLDVLSSINFVNRIDDHGNDAVKQDAAFAAMDFDEDGSASPLDVLILVNHVNRRGADDPVGHVRSADDSSHAEGESESPTDDNHRNRRNGKK